LCTVAKRQRHYYEGDSDNSTEASKRRRVELSPPRSSEAVTRRFIRTRHRKQPSKMGRFVSDFEDDGTSADDNEDKANDSDEEFTLGGRQTSSRKHLRRNGHAAAVEYSERYGTRCATGVIQRKRYDRVFTDDEDDDDEVGRLSRRMFVGSRRNRPAAATDSESEHRQRTLRTPTKSAPSAVLPSSSSSTLRYSHKSEAESSDAETMHDALNGTSQSGSDSGSDTEAYSEGSDAVKSGRMTRSTSGKPVITNGHVKSNYGGGIGAKYRTRNQGRRTVHYEEADSDVDDGRVERRTLDRRRTEIGSRARLCRS